MAYIHTQTQTQTHRAMHDASYLVSQPLLWRYSSNADGRSSITAPFGG